MPSALTREGIASRLDALFGEEEYRITGPYHGIASPASFTHSCGHTITVKAKSMLQGRAKCSCQHTRHLPRITLESHRKEIRRLVGKEFKCLVYRGVKEKATYSHAICGREFDAFIQTFRSYQCCPHCHSRSNKSGGRVSLEEIKRRLRKRYGKNEYRILGEYVNSTTPIRVKHSCGRRYEVPLSQLTRGYCQCPDCVTKVLTTRKEVRVEGKTFHLQGFEPASLERLLRRFNADQIVSGSDVPRFAYRLDGKQHTYIPDFYVPDADLVVEVKSVATLGLTRNSNAFFGEDVFERNQAKAMAVRRSGSRFRLHLFDRHGKRLRIPTNWHSMTKRDLPTDSASPSEPSISR